MAPKLNWCLSSRLELLFVLIMAISYTLYVVIFTVLQTNEISNSKPGDLDDLKLLHVISRHGARNPNFFYPNDPHKNYEFIGGVGQLTNLGKLQQYKLGEMLRMRYHNFLTSNPKEVYARSSATDRTIESALAALAGLYPPDGSWLWNRDLKWQPIPVYSIPEEDDYLLHYRPNCTAFRREYYRFGQTEVVKNYRREHEDLFKLIRENSGLELKEMYEAMLLYSTLEIERQNELALPNWVTEDVLERLRVYSGKVFRFLYGTTKLQKLRGGPLIADMIKNIQSKLDGASKDRKLFFYSTHDAIFAAAMNALNVYNDQLPPFSATLIFEFHSSEENDFLRLYYANSTTPETCQKLHLLQIPGCSSDCPLETFIALTEKVRPVNWKKECFEE